MAANPHNDNSLSAGGPNAYGTTGAAIGSAWGPVGTGIGYAAGNILGSAFSGSGEPQGTNYNMRRELNQRRQFNEQENANAQWGLENIYGKQIQTRTADAKAAGLHPLFAMGVQGYSPPGGSSGGSPVGQSRTGSFKSDAVAGLGKGLAGWAKLQAQKDIVMQQNALSAVARATDRTQNDIDPKMPAKQTVTIANQKMDPKSARPHDSSIQEIEDTYGEVADIVGAGRFAVDWWDQVLKPSGELVIKELGQKLKALSAQQQTKTKKVLSKIYGDWVYQKFQETSKPGRGRW